MMKVIKPLTPAYDYVTSTTATDIAGPWVSGTSYDKGDLVTHPLTNGQPSQVRRWESLVNTNTEEPGTGTQWLDVAPCNKCAMFDQQVSTTTTADSPLVVVLEPGLFNSLALVGLVGTTLAVEVRDGAGGEVVYDREYPLDTTEIFDWYQYFFEPSVQLGSVVMTDIPPYSTSYVTITLSGAAGSTVECGGCIFGTFYALGTAEYGATAGIIDYSRKETDDYGTTTFVRRAFSRRMVVNLMLPTAQVAKLQRILSDLRATPAMWIGSDDVTYTPLQVYGFYRDFQIDIAYPTQSYCSLEIEGLA